MDTMSAFARGMAASDQEHKVFDWNEAARIIKNRKIKTVSAGLMEDWGYTSGYILLDGVIPKKDDTYTYLSSNWATPVLSFDDEIFVECYKMQSEVPNWNSETYWPESARRIIDPFLLTFLT